MWVWWLRLLPRLEAVSRDVFGVHITLLLVADSHGRRAHCSAWGVSGVMAGVGRCAAGWAVEVAQLGHIYPTRSVVPESAWVGGLVGYVGDAGWADRVWSSAGPHGFC